MNMKITQRDKRSLTLAAIVIVAIVLWFTFIEGFFADWKQIRSDLSVRRSVFDSVALSKTLSALTLMV